MFLTFFFTPPAVSPPGEITIEEVRTTAIDISWGPSLVGTGYTVAVVQVASGQGQVLSFPLDTHTATLPNLLPGTQYRITLQVRGTSITTMALQHTSKWPDTLEGGASNFH